MYSERTYLIGFLSTWLTSGMQLPMGESCSCSEISTCTVIQQAVKSKLARLNEDSRKSPADSHVLWYKWTGTVIHLTPRFHPFSYALILSILTLNAGFCSLILHSYLSGSIPVSKHSLARYRWLLAVWKKEPEGGSFLLWYCELSIHTPLFSGERQDFEREKIALILPQNENTVWRFI